LARPGAVGRSIRLDASSSTIIGVMPRGFAYPATAELFVSLAWDQEYDAVAARHMRASAA
jgi:hypothetical protein